LEITDLELIRVMGKKKGVKFKNDIKEEGYADGEIYIV
jgi:hypothetical protein